MDEIVIEFDNAKVWINKKDDRPSSDLPAEGLDLEELMRIISNNPFFLNRYQQKDMTQESEVCNPDTSSSTENRLQCIRYKDPAAKQRGTIPKEWQS